METLQSPDNVPVESLQSPDSEAGTEFPLEADPAVELLSQNELTPESSEEPLPLDLDTPLEEADPSPPYRRPASPDRTACGRRV